MIFNLTKEEFEKQKGFDKILATFVILFCDKVLLKMPDEAPREITKDDMKLFFREVEYKDGSYGLEMI